MGFRVDAVCLCLARVGLKREKKVPVGDARAVGQSWPEALRYLLEEAGRESSGLGISAWSLGSSG